MDQTESPRPPVTQPPVYPSAPVPLRKSPGVFQLATKLFFAVIIILSIFGLGLYVGIILSVSSGSSAASQVQMTRYSPGEGEQRIVIIPLEGMTDNQQTVFVRHCVDHLIANREKLQIAAVVLRVDSPGGPVSPADQTHHHLKRLKEETDLPVIASYGSVAASGGYYISCLADHIIAEPTTITGSIGVIANVMTFGGTMDKLGVTPQVRQATTSPDKERGNNMFRQWDEDDWAVVQPMLDEMHARFIEVVKEGRSDVLDTPEKLKAATTGLAYLGAEAVEMGLVDRVGYLDDALAEARSRAGISDDSPVSIYRLKPTVMQQLFGASAASPQPRIDLSPRTLRDAMEEFSVPRLMYLYQP